MRDFNLGVSNMYVIAKAGMQLVQGSKSKERSQDGE